MNISIRHHHRLEHQNFSSASSIWKLDFRIVLFLMAILMLFIGLRGQISPLRTLCSNNIHTSPRISSADLWTSPNGDDTSLSAQGMYCESMILQNSITCNSLTRQNSWTVNCRTSNIDFPVYPSFGLVYLPIATKQVGPHHFTQANSRYCHSDS